MTVLCFQYLAICSNENLPKSVQIVPKWVKTFAQSQINLKNVAKDFNFFAKVVEFHQIWSRFPFTMTESHGLVAKCWHSCSWWLEIVSSNAGNRYWMQCCSKRHKLKRIEAVFGSPRNTKNWRLCLTIILLRRISL